MAAMRWVYMKYFYTGLIFTLLTAQPAMADMPSVKDSKKAQTVTAQTPSQKYRKKSNIWTFKKRPHIVKSNLPMAPTSQDVSLSTLDPVIDASSLPLHESTIPNLGTVEFGVLDPNKPMRAKSPGYSRTRFVPPARVDAGVSVKTQF